jgi:glycerophosphoryl diester phosphodiesterase
MKHIKGLFLFILLLSAANAFAQTTRTFDIEGHRGARGFMPENTIPSFLKALELGVNTLELDVVVSKDNQLVVSHDPWFSSVISLDQDGKPIPAEKEKEYNLYRMDYSEIRRFDVGSLGNKGFPEQQKMKTYKPLLKEVFSEVQRYIRQKKANAVRYNIEIKSAPEGDNIYHPVPAVFAKMVYDEILANKMEKYVMVQSFDVRALQEIKKFPRKFPLSLLVMNKDGIEANIRRLGFQPDIYSPHFSLVDEATVQYCRQNGMKIIPWTVNEASDMENLKKLNLDGVITDYPNRANDVFRK